MHDDDEPRHRAFVGGEWVTLASLEELVRERSRTFGNDDPATVAARCRLGLGLVATEHDDEAIGLLSNLLSGEPPTTLDAASSFTVRLLLAVAFAFDGRPYDAVSLAEELAGGRLQDAGPDDRAVLATRHVRAVAYLRAGRSDEGLEMLRSLSSDQERALGAGHRDPLATRAVLALQLSTMFRFEEAADVFAGVVRDQRRALGDDHPDTLQTAANHARCLVHAGRGDEVVDVLASLPAALVRVLGPEHPDTLDSCRMLTGAYLTTGRRDDAIDVLTTLLDGRRSSTEAADTDPEDVPGADFRAGENGWSEAEFFASIVAEHLRRFGPDHADTLHYQATLAQVQLGEGDTDEATRALESLLPRQTAVLGADSTEVVATRMYLALGLLECGRVDEAITRCESFLADHLVEFGWHHITVEFVRRVLAAAYDAAGLTADVSSSGAPLHGADGPWTGRAPTVDVGRRIRTAWNFVGSGDGHKAVMVAEPVLVELLHGPGGDERELDVARRVLAAACDMDPPSPDAITPYELAPAHWVDPPAGPDADEFTVLAAIAADHACNDRMTESIDAFSALVDEGIRLRGPTHADTLAARVCLAAAYRDHFDPESAIAVGEAFLADQFRTLGPTDPGIESIREVLAAAYVDVGYARDAEDVIRDHLVAVGGSARSSPVSSDDWTSGDEGHPWDAPVAPAEAHLLDRVTALGPDHPDVVTARRELAAIYALTDFSDDPADVSFATAAVVHLESDRRKAVLAAAAERSDDRSIESTDVLDTVLLDRLRVETDDVTDVFALLGDLATLYRYAGRLSDAVDVLTELVDDRSRTRSPSDPDLLRDRAHLAVCLVEAGRPGDAMAVAETNLCHLSGNLETIGDAATATRRVLATVYEQAGHGDDVDRAVTALVGVRAAAESLDDLMSSFFEMVDTREVGDPDVLRLELHLAWRAVLSGDDEAVPVCEMALVGILLAIGTEDPMARVMRQVLAAAYRRSRERTGTGDLRWQPDPGDVPVRDAVAGRTDTLDSHHGDTLSARAAQVTAYRDAGRVEDAIDVAETLVVDMARVRGRGHPDTQQLRELIGALYREAGYT